MTLSSPERALQIWQILIGKAHNKQTITYIEVAHLLGYTDARPISGFLGYLMDYCAKNNLPPLSVLVVQKDSGTPGSGLTTSQDHAADRQRVFQQNWYALKPPTAEDFKNSRQG